MGLHVRTVMPYALPGVLALLACWWFFSRKKDGRSKKHLSAFADKLHTDDALEELLREETLSSSRAQPVQLDKATESMLPESTACCLSLEELGTSLYEVQPVCKVGDEWKQKLNVQNVAVETMQASAEQEFVISNHSPDLRANEIIINKEDEEICMSSVINLSCETDRLIKDNSNTGLTVVEEICSLSNDAPCVCGQVREGQELSTKDVDHHSGEIQESGSPKEALRTPVREMFVNEQIDESRKSEMKAVNEVSLGQSVPDELYQESDFNRFSASLEAQCHCDQSTIQEIVSSINAQHNNLEEKKIWSNKDDVHTTQTEKNATVKEQDVYPLTDGTQVEDAEEVGLAFKVDVEIHDTQSLESIQLEKVTEVLDLCTGSSIMEVKGVILHDVEPLMEGELSDSCIKSIDKVVEEGNCTEMDAFDKSVVKHEEFENSSLVVESLKDESTKTFLGDYEAKIVEQLALNLISKVIVAARQEILSSSVGDASDNSLAYNENDSLDKDAQKKSLVSEKDVYNCVAANLTQGLMKDCTSESTQTELLQPKDHRNGEIACVRSSMQRDEENNAECKSVYEMPSMSDLSPVHRSTDFFEVSLAAMEDSSISACTSEEGISIDDPLQSTVLSTVCVGSCDSGIELSREKCNVSIEATKVTAVESQTAVYSNGDVKRGSPDLNGEGPVHAESEADHSGGSDVNSMDSVDSGCALGSSEQFPNVKQKSEVKKADLVIWEFEVPKYLVGRLIGKQGRFVSFLKQSSGAKIYISIVPYTQDIQICHLEGSQQQIDRALGLIRKKFKDLNLTNIFAPPPPLIPLPVASWLSLPNNVSVEVVVVNVVNAGHMFVQQRTHPTFHALSGLDHHMSLCYAQPAIPTLPTPAEVGILCAAPVGPSVWWRAQVMAYFEDTEEVEIIYVDYGGYNRVKIETLRQIRSDFVSLPFQGVEVLLDNVIPLGDEDHFSAEADDIVKELTTGAPMLTQVTNYDEATRLPLVQLWRLNPEEMMSINRTLVERGFAEWIESY